MSEPNRKGRVGYLYRRWRGKHVPVSEDIPGVIYMAWKVHGERRVVCLHTTDRHEAERLQADVMGRIKWGDREAYLYALVELGEQAKRELARVTRAECDVAIGDVWTRYEASRRRPRSGDATLGTYRQQWEAFRAWAPQAVRTMGDVTAAMAERYCREMERRLTANTTMKHLTVLRRCWAVLAPELQNPWAGVSPARVDARENYRALSVDEARAVWRAAPDGDWRDLIMLGYYTALRRKDAILLRAGCVDLASDMLVVDAPHKTRRAKSARLRIPMLPELRRMLEARAAGRDAAAWLFPDAVLQFEREPAGASRALSRAFAAAGVLAGADGRASFHSLRATFVTLMDLAGAPHRVTDKVTNHAPASMHDRYSQPDAAAARGYMLRALPPLGEG
jgi:integrase